MRISAEHRLAALAVAVWSSGAVAESPAVDSGPSGTVQLSPVTVVGERASLATAQQIKRSKTEIVDSIVADDINKLPDFSVTDALQRITGVQIGEDRGEGTAVTIRGLTQMETTLDGREVFTAGNGRNLNLTDLPAELVSGIDVYKTSSANLIEGGLGGTIDVRTRRPFDFPGLELAESGRLIHGFLVDHNGQQISTLLSNRWSLQDAGQAGILINASYQRRPWREDQKSAGNPVVRSDLIPGVAVTVPNGTSETTSLGYRDRSAIAVSMQWFPWHALELYLQADYTELKTIQDSYQINVQSSPTFVAGSPELFPGTDDLKSITWTDAPISILSFARDTVDRTRHIAGGSIWTQDALTLKADASYTNSFNFLYFSGPFFAGTAADFSQDLSTEIPSTRVSGTNLLDPASFNYTGVAYRTSPYKGDLIAARVDADYKLREWLLDTLSAGARHAERTANNVNGLIFADASVSGKSVADLPQFAMPDPYDFFPGYGPPSIKNHLVGNLFLARDPLAQRAAFGITTPIPDSASPLSLWNIDEATDAGYLMARIRGGSMPLDGNVGMRIVHTGEVVKGSQTVPNTSLISPVDVDSGYTDYLPSLNLRYRIGDGLYLRTSASKTVTRPDFNQLAPSLVLIPNPVNPALNSGSAGNPYLSPIRADNVDLAIEQYFGRTTSVYLTGFWKKVNGFIVTVSAPETYGGLTYQVSRPQNANVGLIRGFEIGYQQFYDFLPGWLNGLGFQANYTYIDSNTPSSILGSSVPLQNLSTNSYNLIGMYEKEKVSVRVAYNWRDRYLSSINNFVGVGSVPGYTAAYGWLDASVTYRFSEQLSLSLQGNNLTDTRRSSYYGTEQLPQNDWIDDTEVSLLATVQFK